MKCEKCGAELPALSRECPECGYMRKLTIRERVTVKAVFEWVAVVIFGAVFLWVLGTQDIPWWAYFFLGIPVYLIMLLLGRQLGKGKAEK